jgi:hypothetical protein
LSYDHHLLSLEGDHNRTRAGEQMERSVRTRGWLKQMEWILAFESCLHWLYVAGMSDISPPIGFKEWTFVCEALGQGVQTIILRKGGIHEGRGGFHFEHDAFFLFPTGFHNQGELLHWLPDNAAQISVPQDEERQSVDVRYFAKLHAVWKLTDWDKVAALEPLHVWKSEVVRERFAWNEESSLHVALVRVFRLPEVWSFPYQKSFGGCRSWVKLPVEGEDLMQAAVPVQSDEVWAKTEQSLRSILG